MEEKYNAIVTRAVSYRENDLMLTLFTLERGMVSACLRGAKKARAKLKFAGELFCFGEFVLIEKDGRRTVKEVNQIDGFYSLRLDDKKFFAASSVLEYLNGFMLDGIESYDLFLNTVNLFKDYKSDVNVLKSLIAFYIKALSLSGYALDFSDCASCGSKIENRVFFDFDEGRCYCASCAKNEATEIRLATYLALTDLIKNENCVVENEPLLNALRLIDYYIKLHSGVTINSHKYLLAAFLQ